MLSSSVASCTGIDRLLRREGERALGGVAIQPEGGVGGLDMPLDVRPLDRDFVGAHIDGVRHERHDQLQHEKR